MFPTSGLFQEFLCPFFSEGQCDRPYCHFNHSKPPIASTVDSESAPSMEATPVYKPTPIKLLEKLDVKSHADTNSGSETDENGFVKPVTPPQLSIPIYQPTPISELEKYAPSALSAYGLPNGTGNSCFATPETPPTYSPVVRPKQVAITAPVEFLYQPSPAYPPITEKDSCPINPSAAFSGSSDEDDGPVGELSPTSNSTKKRVRAEKLVPKIEPRSSCSTAEFVIPNPKKIKRKLAMDQKTSAKAVPSDSSPSVPSERVDASSNECSAIADAEKNPEEADCAVTLKRQKLISLYHDLYGEEPEAPDQEDKSQPSGKKASKTIRGSIAPYQGDLPAKLPKKQSSNTEASASPSRSSEPPMPRPLVPLRKSDKIPMPIRTRYLDQFIEECLVIYQSPNDAYERALTDEQACHDKATSRMAYLNAVIQRLKSLKAEKAQAEKEGVKRQGAGASRSQPATSRVKSESNLTGSDDSAEKKLDEVVRGPLFYDQLRPYLLDEDALVANGFPREDKTAGSPRGRATLSIPEDKRALYTSCQENERICCRCGARFIVDEFGNAVVSQKCVYHWSRPVKLRTPGTGFDLRYPCCQGEVGQAGCQICPTGHVHEANKWLDNEGFVSTLPPLPPSLARTKPADHEDEESGSDEDSGDPARPVNIYAIDCEMVYTTAGCELARCTIVDTRLRTVLDCVVQPDHTVLDCNTRFSGLQLEQIEAATMRITDVQARLLHLFDSDSILIGHSLESDLCALKLIHSKVVDTSVVFPHRLGPPKKRALRNLVGDYLQRIIQQGECGHNSLEDASACMELMQYKVKEDLRRGKWAFK